MELDVLIAFASSDLHVLALRLISIYLLRKKNITDSVYSEHAGSNPFNHKAIHGEGTEI